MLLQVRCKHADADFVHPCGPAIPLDRTEGFQHQLGSNPPRQRMNLDLLAHAEPFTLCNHRVRIVGLSGMFLSLTAGRLTERLDTQESKALINDVFESVTGKRLAGPILDIIIMLLPTILPIILPLILQCFTTPTTPDPHVGPVAP